MGSSLECLDLSAAFDAAAGTTCIVKPGWDFKSGETSRGREALRYMSLPPHPPGALFLTPTFGKTTLRLLGSPLFQAGFSAPSGVAAGLDYAKGDATVEATYPLSSTDKVTPSYGLKSGEVAVTVARELEGGGLVATFRKELVDVSWKDGDWVCDVSLPYDGSRSDVRMRRGVKW